MEQRQPSAEGRPSTLEDTITEYERGGNLNKKMVHFERSPTYCAPIPSLNLPGTTGRVCNSTTSEDINSCSALCCGRGYFTVKVRRVEKCDCEFHWCCYVVCQECAYEEWVTVCKWSGRTTSYISQIDIVPDVQDWGRIEFTRYSWCTVIKLPTGNWALKLW